MRSLTSMELHKNSSFSSRLYFFQETINSLRLELSDGTRRELTHPQLSRDFIYGILEDSRGHGFFRRSELLGVEFICNQQINLPELSFTRKTIGEQLLQIAFPNRLRVCYRGALNNSLEVTAVGLFRGFLVTDFPRNHAIPLAALSTIEVECA